MAPKQGLSIRLPRPLLDEIDRRTYDGERGTTAGDRVARLERDEDTDATYTAGQVARAWLNRYVEICRQHAPEKWLSRAEIAVVCDANGGPTITSVADERGLIEITGVVHNVVDAIAIARGALPDPATGAPQILARHRVGDERPVDGDELVAKLHRASFADLVALADFVDRFWSDDPAANATIYPDAK